MPSGIAVGTNLISLDEPCFSLREEYQQAPDGKGFRRYQVIKVVRGDKIASFMHDMGPQKTHKADCFVIPGGVWDVTDGHGELLHTVGELRDIADRIREEQPKTGPIEGVYGN